MIKLYNTLTRKIEEFKPIKKGFVGIYSCGPTVYDHLHIGHFRSYTFVDILKRVLIYNGFKVRHVMNLTDVGHLTEYDVEEQMKKKGKGKGTVWEIAEFYTQEFFEAMEKLNVLRADIICKASEHIKEQIELIKRLEERGYAYKIDDGIYYDISKFPDYGKLGRLKLDGQEPGARVDVNPQKKNPYDFALWKFSKPEECRAMEWNSPWGRGVPGWHIECSAMSIKYLGETFDPFGKLRVNGEHCRTIDIHTGGEDLIPIHHTNEIAQSEAATGKKFVRYWVHNAYLMVEGEKMSRSKGNFYTMDDILKRDFNSLVFRYLCLTTHYRAKMNFTWEALKGAQSAYDKLVAIVGEWRKESRKTSSVAEFRKIQSFRKKFKDKINNDLNTPQALVVLWRVVKSDLPGPEKLGLILDWDKVLGLRLEAQAERKIIIPKEIQKLVEQREKLRQQEKWVEADKIRKKIEKLGWKIEDTSKGPKIRKEPEGGTTSSSAPGLTFRVKV